MALSGRFTTTAYDGRYYEFSWSATQNIAGNYSTISWSLEAKGGSVGYYVERAVELVIDGSTEYSKTSAVNRYEGIVARGTKTIYHNTNGSRSFSASLRAQTYYSMYINNGSGSWSLTNIPKAATITSAPASFNDEATELTITYNNAAGTAVDKLHACIAIYNSAVGYWEDTGAAYREISRTSSSYTFTLTDAERKALRKAVKTGNSVAVKFYLRTTFSGSYYFDTNDSTLTLVNYTPTITPTVKDIGGNSTKLTGNPQTIIKGFNVIEYNIGGAGRKEATIVNQRITCGAQTTTAPTGTLVNVASGLFEFRVIDTRDTIAETTKTLTMIDYKPLTCKLSASIELDGETTSKISFDITGDYWSGNFGTTSNSLELYYKIKEISDNWIPLTPQINTSKGTYSFSGVKSGLDYQKQYTVEVKAIDKVYSEGIAANSVTLKTIPVFDWSETDFNFNVPILRNNKEIDFIVDQGEKNGWYYRKWSSGFAECWYTASVSGIDVGEFNMNGFYYCGSKGVSFPFTFTKVNYVNATGGSTGNMNIVRPFNYSTTNMTYIVMGNADISSATVTINLEVKGKWR
jgi:hypothetical protein